MPGAILVVVGSVTAEQYKDARIRMLDNGRSPEVVRLRGEDVMLTDEQMLMNDPLDPALPPAFDNLNTEDIYSVVVPEELWDVHGPGLAFRCVFQDREYDSIFSGLEDRWLVRTGRVLYYV